MPIRVEEKEETGIFINSFATANNFYMLKDDREQFIDAIAEGEAKNIKEETVAKFSCAMDISLITNTLVSIPGEVSISPNKEYLKEAPMIFHAGEEEDVLKSQDFAVNCRIKKDEVKRQVDLGKIGERTAFTGIIKLQAIYNAKTRSSVRVYTSARKLSENELSNFKTSLRSDQLWAFNNRLVSLTRGGAMDAFIDIKKIQPITQPGSYFFTLGLMNTKGWKGKLEQLNNIDISFSRSGMKIDYDRCNDFENNALKADIIDAINNKKCRIEQKGKYEPECILQGVNVDNLPFTCAVEIEDLNPDLGYSLLMADFDYDYAVTSTTTANFQVDKEASKQGVK